MRTRKLVTREEVEAWCKAHDQGETAQHIALESGRGRCTVIRHLERSGRTPHACFEHATTRELREWCEAYDEGDTVGAIAFRYGRSPETVKRHLAPTGRVTGSIGRRPGMTEVSKRIAELLGDGVAPSAIAERLGINKGVVYRLKSKIRRKGAA